MKIPRESYQGHLTDADSAAFFELFDEPYGSAVIEVGAHDEPVANVLSSHGYRVTGVDLREYHTGQDLIGKAKDDRPCNYRYVRADFCDLPSDLMYEGHGGFDVAVSLSALEHFGFGTYQEGKPHVYYDVIAMRTMWQLLREGGVAYITVPFGKDHLDVFPHWRVYNTDSLRDRLVQDFDVEFFSVFVAGPCVLAGRNVDVGSPITTDEAMTFSGTPPHLSAMLKLRKGKVQRLAPDGR